MNKLLLTIVILGVCTQVSAKKKGDAENGEKLAAEGYCYTCHGDKGIAPSRNAPSLAGQGERYIYKTLEHYKKKKIMLDNKSLGMQGIVQSMSKKQMRDLAAYYAAQELPQKANRGKVPDPIEDSCGDCHSTDGTPAKKGKYPGLGGMTAAYIKRQIEAYKDSRRAHKKMDVDELNELSAKQLDEIANFYANEH